MALGSASLARFPSRTGGTKDDIAQRVYAHISNAKTILQSDYWAWYDAVAFYRGDQWTYWDPGTRRVRRRPALPWRIRVTDNQVLPLLQMQLALLIERIPTFRALARTTEEADVQAALGFEALLIYQWDRLELTQKLADVLHTALVCGNGFWRVTWNPKSGRPLLAPQLIGESVAGAKDAPRKDEGVEQGAESEFAIPGFEEPPERLYEGDVHVECVSPFNFHVDPAARDLGEAKWVCQESFIHRDVLIERLGSKAKNINPDVGIDEFYQYETNLRFDSRSSNLLSDDMQAAVRVLEYWEAPSKKYPDGRVYTVAGGETLDRRDNPYGGRYPFVHFPAIKVHGKFWADGYVKHLRPLQTMHNRAVSRYHEIMNLMSNPKWVADKGSGLKETSLNDRPGEVVMKNPGSEVHPVPPPPAPTIHPQVMAAAMNSMQTLSGVNDPLVGNNPAGVRSGRSLAFLQESGMRRFIPLSLQTEHALRQCGRMVLHLCKRFYSEDRTVRVLGADSRPQIYRMGEAEVGRVEDVTIVHGSMIPKSRAAQQDNALELLARAPMVLLDDQGQFNRDWVLSTLDMPAATGRITPDMEARQHVKAEHIDALNGRPLTAQPWENDILHMREHGSWLNSQEARDNPEAMAAVAEHYAMHEMQHMQKMGGGMVDIHGSASQGGAPPGPGAPPTGGPGGPTPPNSDREGGLPQPDPGAALPGGSR